MEPNIKNVANSNDEYSEILSAKIKEVCSKVNCSYEGIKWIIFDPYKNTSNSLEKIMVGRKGTDYGYYDLKNKIWISTLAIKKEINKTKNNNKKYENDFLANLILDEITHMITKCDHGTKKYDDQLKRFKNIYYDRNLFFSKN